MDQPSQIDTADSAQSLSAVSFATCVAAGAWFALAISCWAFAAWTPATKFSPSWLTTIAIASAMVTASMRFYPADLQRHAAWRQMRTPLALAAAVNWLGFILIRSPEPLAALPSLLIFLLSEAGVYVLLQQSKVGERCEFKPELRFSPLGEATLNTDQLESLLAEELASREVDDREQDCGEQDDALSPYLTRKQQVGTDEQGQQYVAGELYVSFDGDQRVTHAVVAFQPAFSLPPDVELESDNADISVELQNCTPVGMRLQLRLDRSAQAPASTIVAFYATAASSDRPVRPAPLP